jgi:hypothetical protein
MLVISRKEYERKSSSVAVAFGLGLPIDWGAFVPIGREYGLEVRTMAMYVENGRSQSSGETKPPVVAVLIPCYNEESTIFDVVAGFREQLPAADIYVFDNNSSDRTVAEARRAEARVYREARQGKGYVVQTCSGRSRPTSTSSWTATGRIRQGRSTS